MSRSNYNNTFPTFLFFYLLFCATTNSTDQTQEASMLFCYVEYSVIFHIMVMSCQRVLIDIMECNAMQSIEPNSRSNRYRYHSKTHSEKYSRGNFSRRKVMERRVYRSKLSFGNVKHTHTVTHRSLSCFFSRQYWC